MGTVERKRRAIVGLALFRASLGVVLALMPWIVGDGLDGYGATQVAAGVAIVAMAPWMNRWPQLRWLQALLALGILFAPFAFDTRDMQIYVAVLLGKTLLITSIVSARIFES
jgi:hypothetical protein